MVSNTCKLIALLCVSVGSYGCSDDDAKTTPDGATPDVITQPSDAGPSDGPIVDSAAGDSSRDVSTRDGATVDVPWGVPACDPACQAEGSHLCFKDSNGDCHECDTSTHCLANATALGPRCEQFGDTKYCVCDEDSDCENNPNGLVCYRTLRVCACQKDLDCPQGKTCSGLAGSISICI